MTDLADAERMSVVHLTGFDPWMMCPDCDGTLEDEGHDRARCVDCGHRFRYDRLRGEWMPC